MSQVEEFLDEVVQLSDLSDLSAREVLDALPAAVYLTDADGRVEYFNRAAARMAGREAQVGVDRWCVSHRLFRTDGSFLPHDECPMAVCIKERRPVRGEEIIAERPDGERVRLMPFPTPLYRDGVFAGGLNLLVDLSHLRRTEQALAARASEQEVLYRFTDRLYRAQSSAEVREAALDAITTGLDCPRASILLADEAEVMRFVAWRGLSDDYRQALEGHSPWPARTSDPQPVWVEDIEATDEPEAVKAKVLAEGIRGLAFIPLVADGVLAGKFMVYYPEAHVFTQGERDLALTIARQLGFTIEQRRAEAERRDAASRLRLAMDAGRMAVWEHDTRSDRLTASPELNRLLGFPPDKALGAEDLKDRYYPGERERLRAHVEAQLRQGERFVEAQFRFYRADGDLRWFLVRAEFRFGADGAPARTLGVLLDITEQKAAEEALRAREADLSAALEAGALAIVDFDHATGRFASSPRVNDLYGYPPERELTLADVRARYHPEEAERLDQLARAEHGDPSVPGFHWTLRLLIPDGSTRWVEGRGEYLRDEAGRVLRSRGVLMDITERKRWEEHQRLLVNELNHRVKNTLAVVQGLARQSLGRSEAAARAQAAFESRLEALSAAHNLLTTRNWRSASVSQIISSSVAAAIEPAGERVQAEGPDILLPPQTAVSVALAIHELATNAVKYGALSAPEGVVGVSWRVYDAAGRARFTLEWIERGGPAVEPPPQTGFGARMIERGLATELGGSARIHFEPAGVRCVIDAPLPETVEDTVALEPAGLI